MKHSGLSAMARRMTAPPISWLMSLALARPQLISLAAGFTDNESLPVSRTRALLDQIFSNERTGRVALQYGTTAGDPELRHLTAARLQQLDSRKAVGKPIAPYDPDRVLITHGSQQFLYLVTECLCDAGDIVLVEDPTYFVFLGITQSRDLRCRGLRMESDGVDLASLEQVLEELKKAGELTRLKFLYLISYFQNPSGVTTSFEKKTKILELLRRYEPSAGHPIYLLEDGAYRDLEFGDAATLPPSALAASKFANRVIYTGTYSKPFATGVRAGYGLLPEPIYTCALRAKGNHDFGTVQLAQQLILRALKTGEFDDHLAHVRTRYQNKAAVMVGAMQKHFPPSVQWAKPDGGLYIWVKLPSRLACSVKSKFFQAALAHEVLYVPGELCYADDSARRKPTHEMRLSFGSATEHHIREGIKRLGIVLKEALL